MRILQADVTGGQVIPSGETGGDAIENQRDESVEDMLRAAVDGVLAQNDAARDAHDALRERGFGREEAREEIARVLLAVMHHVDRRSELLREAGGGAELRRRAFRRIAEGETAKEIFE